MMTRQQIIDFLTLRFPDSSRLKFRKVIASLNSDMQTETEYTSHGEKIFHTDEEHIVSIYERICKETSENKRKSVICENSISSLSKQWSIHADTIVHLCERIGEKISVMKQGSRDIRCLDEETAKRVKNYIDDILKTYSSVKVWLMQTTSVDRYGVSSHTQLAESRKEISERAKANAHDRLAKAVCTRRAKYGKGNNADKIKETWQSKAPEEMSALMHKTRESIINKYGTYQNYIDFNVGKGRNTIKQKYGVDNVGQISEVKEAIRRTKAENIQKLETELNAIQKCKVIREYGQGWANYLEDVKEIHKGCYTFIPLSEIPKIKEYASYTGRRCVSRGEKSVVSFIKSIYAGIVEENTKNVIKPKELDIYIKEKSFAIEFDGLRWHKDDEVSCTLKTELCRKKNIFLMHIFEDEWTSETDKCKSYLMRIIAPEKLKLFEFDGLVCIDIDSKTTCEFMKENSLDEWKDADRNLGLFNGDTLIGCWSTEGNVLCNVAVKNFCRIEKFLENILAKMDYNTVETEIDCRLTNPAEYTDIGFEPDGYIQPTFKYIINKRRSKTKDVDNKYIPRIYDSGKQKLKYTKEQWE